ncbi:glycosyl hydrolase [Flaviramulus sp. BrNp1-15]|uniref:WD40/YVTN/BNR-like repeat-containing protein n=1 Tax=Flaviramulus sp. BrNp1-15 TaxID=2916754 RepID=UPI001EE7886A|nr:exo-alpha-sialidase [Flaviramulus sp. BrNp1-15]ULC59048.1 glycosyl hydrolase [Flaviramulus sp. BrNp1-15]
MTNSKKIFLTLISLFLITSTFSQEETEKKVDSTLSGLKFRSIGPAFMSGRIADIAIDPNNQNTWYVAVGSGGVWKTNNAGTTWEPLSDKQPFFSTGCLTLDPNNSSKVWLGTGENVGGRHVGIGHGIYVSHDGGKSWENKGLKNSEHISKIIVNPKNSNEIWVAVQGPLWSSGGERGLYKSIDGGDTWKLVLKDNEWTGVTDIVIDPRDEKILYAATWQRHRNVAAYIGGGEGTALYKSTDGGETWDKLKNGLPNGDMGKIGLAISPINPDVLYAAIELNRKKGAIYRSNNKGGSWTKMSETVSGGTGPHYYQELVASPHVFDKIYLMDVRVRISENGGKTFYTMKESNKHSDNHSMTFKPDDPNYLLVGTDGGIYESFDNTETWKFVNNLPLTQFYKVAVDDAEPFYNIYGGTQDNNSQGGPSRTLRSDGITNSDWFVVLGGDGHQPATEPGNPDIVYAQSQQGNLRRVDRTTGETTYIKPQAGIDEPYERNNWDSPILVSSHDPKRLYFGTQRVWRSDNRGDSWKPISKDLTKNEERITLPIMGKQQSWDAAWDVYAMSTYNTITSLSESPLDENILYAGTDDGVIQYTKNGGQTWTKQLVSSLPNVPASAFVNDIKADLHNSNIVYTALDNHKFGDYKPYLLKSTNGGKSWKSITNGIPENTMIWRIVQDHVNPNLLFLATEYGIYVSLNQGEKWIKFSEGLPTISFRDLAIQKRENDLVAASFGRGFYILDDYSPLRTMTENAFSKSQLFKPRKSLQYKPISGGTSSQGESYFKAQNPDYGAIFTYYLPDNFESLKNKRTNREKTLKKENKNIPFPGWNALDEEKNEEGASIILVIKDSKGDFVARVNATYKKGFNRVSWNLKQSLRTSLNIDNINDNPSSYYYSTFVDEGTYTVSMFSNIKGEIEALSESQTFEVERIRENVLKNPLINEMGSYIEELKTFRLELESSFKDFSNASKKLKALDKATAYINGNPGDLEKEITNLKKEMLALDQTLNGNSSKKEIGEKDYPSISSRVSVALSGFNTTYGPTKMHMESLDMAKTLFNRVKPKLDKFINVDIPEIEKKLLKAGVPPILD